MIDRTLNMYGVLRIPKKKLPQLSQNWSDAWEKNSPETPLLLLCGKGRKIGEDKHNPPRWKAGDTKFHRNDFIVVDLDYFKRPKDEIANHSFQKEFGTKTDIIERFNTFIVESGSRNLHIYFKYDADLKHCINTNLHIDLLSDGGVVVPPNSTDLEKSYIIRKDDEFGTIPDDLKQYLLKNQQKQSITSNSTRKMTNGQNYQPQLKINLSMAKFESHLEKLSQNYLVETETWKKFTTVCKLLSSQPISGENRTAKDIWREYSQKLGGSAFNEDKNDIIWKNDTGEKEWVIYKLFKDININLGLHAYKPIPTDTNIKIDETIQYNEKTRTHLDSFQYKLNHPRDVTLVKEPISLLNTKFEDKERLVVVWADTGVGKTTSFISLLKKQPFIPFISIVSRISLAQDHYNKFTKEDNDGQQILTQNIKIYKIGNEKTKCEDGDSVVITIDSLYTLWRFDFSNYVIFMDEYASLLQYILTYEELARTRVKTFILLLHIIKEAKFVYCCDADITQTCLKLVPHAKVITHTKRHNMGVKATEAFDKKVLLAEIVKHNEWILCCDSKMDAKKFKEELTKMLLDEEKESEILLITSETKNEIMENLQMDDHPRIIYSPKIVYGLDSQMERPVFAYYTKMSISSAGMIQQICRCRKITKLMFMFANQYIMPPKYQSRDDCLNKLNKRDKIANDLTELRNCKGEQDSNLFLELLCDTEYNKDCDASNKRYHFINRLIAKGFVLTQEFNRESKLDKENEKSLTDKIKAQDLERLPELSKKLNEKLRIPKERIEEFGEIFREAGVCEEHFNYCELFYKGEDYSTNKMLDQNSGKLTDFIVNAVVCKHNKINFVRNFMKKTESSLENLSPRKGLEKKLADKTLELYKEIFGRDRTEDKNDLTNVDNCESYLKKMLTHLIGNTVTRKRIMVKRKRRYPIIWNEERKSFHDKIYKFREGLEDKLESNGRFLGNI